MVVCNYFLQGRCKFGDQCRFDHPAQAAESNRNLFREREGRYYDDFIKEIIAAERGHQWPLSSFSPFRDHPGAIPNLEDTSPEELRNLFYQAKAEGRLSDYMNHFNALIKKSEETREFLKRPSPELGRLLEDILSNKIQAAPSVPDAKSSFRFSVDAENKGSSIFGGVTPVMPAPATAASNIFARPPEPAAASSSIFGGAPTQTPFFSSQPSSSSQSLFGSSQAAPQNIFSAPQPQVPAPTQNLFQLPPSQSIFQAPTATNVGSSPFAVPNIVNSASSKTLSATQAPLNVYSPIEELTEEETKIYKAHTFAFGKIPLKPPPESLC